VGRQAGAIEGGEDLFGKPVVEQAAGGEVDADG
jgi:hypothetical protein